MYTLRSIVKRGLTLTAGLALVAATFVPAMPASADSLNPLTNRSLTLSSSSPGWSYTDGSGNTTYAPPNSGANGQKTGNTFQFNVSTDTTSTTDKVKTMTFQYCTTSAGLCRAPGDMKSSSPDPTTTADLDVVTSSPAEVAPGDFGTVVNTTTGLVKAVPGFSNPLDASDSTGVYAAKDVVGNFVVYRETGVNTWTQSTGWTMETATVENATADPGDGTPITTGKDNYIILKNATGEGFAPSEDVKVVFFGTADNYITNPGSGAFFVKINTYNKEYAASPTGTQVDLTGLAPANDANVIDGGVTVANVMNQSIQITTKVLETMQFSVGTVDPNTLSSDRGVNPSSPYEDATFATPPATAAKHGVCDNIATAAKIGDPQNILPLGNQSAESSLEVAHTYSTHSYWRLSSNSSAGATVYYSGHTLSNTVGDQIAPIGATADAPKPGSEQFGIAIANTNSGNHLVDYAQEATYENGADNGLTGLDATMTSDGTTGNASWHAPQLYPLVPTANYGGGAGVINGSPTTSFAFDPTSDTVPVAIATEPDQVVDCVTAKMRYIANIAAITPAGIYTTKINYIAAPQY